MIKQAYIYAREQGSDQDFAEQLQCVFFLATPHRGSDYTGMLNNILKATGFLSSKNYRT